MPAHLPEPKKEDVMKDLDLIIFTIVISTSFIFFGISTFKEFEKASKKDKD
jgi:hypothetical protein